MSDQEQIEAARKAENAGRHKILKIFADTMDDDKFDAMVEPHFQAASPEDQKLAKKFAQGWE